MGFKRIVFAMLLVAAFAAPAFAGEGKWGGEVFGDLYWFAADHDSTIEDQNGMWVRRINLGYDYKFNEVYSGRVRLEAASPGDFTSSTMSPFIKDAWLKWSHGNQAVLLGLQVTPTFNIIETMWGYRSVERTPVDLQGNDGSRDMGIGAIGTFGANKRIGYHVLLANGNGTKSETDSKKKIMGAVNVRPTDHLVFEVFGAYEDRTNEPDRTSMQAFAGYQGDALRAGLQWFRQIRNTVGDDFEYDIASGFIAARATDKMWLFGRVDRNDANPNGAKIAYIPFDPTAKNTFVVAGIDWLLSDEKNDKGKLIADAHIMPNVEAVFYDTPDAGGPAPDTDVIPRLTFFFRF